MNVKVFTFSGALLVQLFGEGPSSDFGSRVVVKEGLPKGATIRDARMVHGNNTFQLLVEHESFPELPEALSMWNASEGLITYSTQQLPEERRYELELEWNLRNNE
jgi:hypothetical protein